jgi:hypothetical protein
MHQDAAMARPAAKSKLPQRNDGVPDNFGMFDGFEGYRKPSAQQQRDALRTALVVVDANVLLNLYRYTATTRDDLFAVLSTVGDRLWVPHQVMREFWRNR